MELSKQVVSLELAQKMKELDAPQESLFEHLIYKEKTTGSIKTSIAHGSSGLLDRRMYHRPERCAAYTVAELGNLLWEAFEKIGWDFLYKAYGEVFNFKGTQRIGELGIVNLMRNPDMGAKMWIYLKENNFIEQS